jgi:tryptophanyl-tRNA synthetase
MRPTGRLHLGHYFGALKNWVKLQDEMDFFYGVADWHALTTNFEDPSDIKENTRQVVLDWLSVGLDINKSTVFIQSHNLAHAELYLLLGMVTPVSWLERTPTYKEQQREIEGKDLSNFGFLGYPVLMTADIIIYDAAFVPVGIDQVPHVELSREIVRHFHSLYNTTVFVEPKPLLTELPKLPGLDGRKMSKSYNNSITLSEDLNNVKQKLLKMITDTNRKLRKDPGEPNVCPCYEYHKVFSTKDELSSIATDCRLASIGCIDCKKILLWHVNEFLEPIQSVRKKLEKEVIDIKEFLAESQKKANLTAGQTVSRVRDALKI